MLKNGQAKLCERGKVRGVIAAESLPVQPRILGAISWGQLPTFGNIPGETRLLFFELGAGLICGLLSTFWLNGHNGDGLKAGA